MNIRADFSQLPFPQTGSPQGDSAVLTLEQRAQLEAFARTLTPDQVRWLSGYFAGLHAGLAADSTVTPHAAPQSRTLTVIYASETGNGRGLARDIAALATRRGLPTKVTDAADYKVRQMKDEQDMLLIVSTHGEGDPPEPATGFFEFIESARAARLPALRYSVLALGDSTYEHFCEAGKRIDRRLEALGATRLCERLDCDVDYDELAAAWAESLIHLLAADCGRGPAPAAAREPVRAEVHDKRHPFPATVLENIRIVGRGSTKETRHVELDLGGAGLSYRPGDALGIAASNDPTVVEKLLTATGLAGDDEVVVKSSSISLASALTTRCEITGPSPRFIEQWAKLSGAAELHSLTSPTAAAERVHFLERNHVVDIVRRFPVTGIEAGQLVEGLRPLQPRLYSIASSQAAVGDEAHLTVAPVRFELHGTERGGVASTQIADRLGMGDTVPVYIQENPHFRLPDDDVPMVMVGPGTGVAPFRAFLLEREARAAAGRSWLFFGERNLRTDFLYQVEWQQWLKDGVLTRLDVAFSRDSDTRTYVQHRMLERSRELYAWLEEGAHFYLCGDEKNMARDVHRALVRIIELEAGSGREAAEDYVRRLSAERRYLKDVY
jgi:sulfite reductase (NADPH) flavoprotein alpha-component